MGVKTHLSSFPAEALGGLTLGVTPLEMADVYATLADGGWRDSPIAITKVVFPDGHVDTNWGQPHRTKVLSEGVTAEETNILHQNVLGGTATRSAIDCPTAAKTGTTSELVDAWLDGYTPNYSTVVWMGYPTRRVSMTDVHGEPQQGGYLPAEIWHAYMAAVTEGKGCAPFPESKEQISYEPFYGKYASTGQAHSAPSQEFSERPSERPATRRERRHQRAETEAQAPSPPTRAPSRPSVPAEAPTVRKTGGAAPG
jgi:penicillin-binding protein 1A